MVQRFFSKFILFMALTFSFSIGAFADTYQCTNDDIKVSYEVVIDESRTGSVDVPSFEVKTLNQSGEILEKVTGIGFFSEKFENGQLAIKKYVLAGNSELILGSKDSKIRFIKRSASGNAGSYSDCILNP